MQSTVLIYLGGTGPIRFPVEIDKLKLVKVIAADSGIELAQKHNTHVDVLVGVLDSASEHCILIAEKDNRCRKVNNNWWGWAKKRPPTC